MTATALHQPMTHEPGLPTPDHYLSMTQPGDWLNSNDRRHHKAEAALVKLWRNAAHTYALAAKLPRDITPVRIICRLSFATRGHRDPGNWYPTAKACLDGLRDAGVLADDTAAHVIGPDMRLGPYLESGERGVIVFEMWRLDQTPHLTAGVRARRSDTPVTRARATLPAALALTVPDASTNEGDQL